MEEAMQKFESMVGSAEKKLDTIEKKIDAEFSKQLGPEGDDDDLDDRASLLAKLEEVKAEYSTLCQEAQDVSTAQREMAKVFQQELLTQVRQLQTLQDHGITGEPRSTANEPTPAIESLAQHSEFVENLSQTFNQSEDGNQN